MLAYFLSVTGVDGAGEGARVSTAMNAVLEGELDYSQLAVSSSAFLRHFLKLCDNSAYTDTITWTQTGFMANIQ
jgi:hypothetical protein